jgi:erythromycin esterase-like protein
MEYMITQSHRAADVRIVSDVVRGAAQRLPDIDDPSFGTHFDAFASARIILIGCSRYYFSIQPFNHSPKQSYFQVTIDGNCSYGTLEFQRARAAITKHLISTHNFNIIGIGADWPDMRVFDRHVRCHPLSDNKPTPLTHDHFFQWVSDVEEPQNFLDWLRQHNQDIPQEKRVGMYGLDFFSTEASLDIMTGYLESRGALSTANKHQLHHNIHTWTANLARYCLDFADSDHSRHEDSVMKMLRKLLTDRLNLAAIEGAGEFLHPDVITRMIEDANEYYRAIFYTDTRSWNQRNLHMFSVLQLLLKVRPDARAVIWVNNSQAGASRCSNIETVLEKMSIGQLCKQSFEGSPGNVVTIGCSMYGGENSTVACSNGPGEPVQIKQVEPSLDGSYEHIMHETGIGRFLLDLRDRPENQHVRQVLMKPRLERSIAFRHQSEMSKEMHYSVTVLPKKLDALVWFDQTTASKRYPQHSAKDI